LLSAWLQKGSAEEPRNKHRGLGRVSSLSCSNLFV
jgi:hypothetical protein